MRRLIRNEACDIADGGRIRLGVEQRAATPPCTAPAPMRPRGDIARKWCYVFATYYNVTIELTQTMWCLDIGAVRIPSRVMLRQGGLWRRFLRQRWGCAQAQWSFAAGFHDAEGGGAEAAPILRSVSVTDAAGDYGVADGTARVGELWLSFIAVGANQSCVIERRGFVVRLAGYDLRGPAGLRRG